MKSNKPNKLPWRSWWIEHKLFIDEWVYEAYETNEERTNKDIAAVHVVEATPILAEVEKLRAEINELESEKIAIAKSAANLIDKLREENAELKASLNEVRNFLRIEANGHRDTQEELNQVRTIGVEMQREVNRKLSLENAELKAVIDKAKGLLLSYSTVGESNRLDRLTDNFLAKLGGNYEQI